MVNLSSIGGCGIIIKHHSPSGNLSGLGVQNPRPREISRASGDVYPNTSLLSAVYGYMKQMVMNENQGGVS